MTEWEIAFVGVEGPREMRDYLAYVRREAQRFLAQGLTVVEASKRIDLGPYAGWTEPERIVFQVERAYRELNGVAYDTPLDVNVLFAGMYEVRQARTHRGWRGRTEDAAAIEEHEQGDQQRGVDREHDQSVDQAAFNVRGVERQHEGGDDNDVGQRHRQEDLPA